VNIMAYDAANITFDHERILQNFVEHGVPKEKVSVRARVRVRVRARVGVSLALALALTLALTLTLTRSTWASSRASRRPAASGRARPSTTTPPGA